MTTGGGWWGYQQLKKNPPPSTYADGAANIWAALRWIVGLAVVGAVVYLLAR